MNCSVLTIKYLYKDFNTDLLKKEKDLSKKMKKENKEFYTVERNDIINKGVRPWINFNI